MSTFGEVERMAKLKLASNLDKALKEGLQSWIDSLKEQLKYNNLKDAKETMANILSVARDEKIDKKEIFKLIPQDLLSKIKGVIKLTTESENCETKEASNFDIDVYLVDEATQFVKDNNSKIRRIIKQLNFMGSFTKGKYHIDWVLTQQRMPNGDMLPVKLTFRSSGFVLHDMITLKSILGDLSSILVVPATLDTAILQGNKLKGLEISVYIK